MIPHDNTAAAIYRDLAGRVAQVARLDRRCALLAGLGRVIGVVGGGLFAVTLVEYLVGLPLGLRVLALPGAAGAVLWLGWRAIVRPLLRRYSTTRAALLVEAHQPDLNSVLVSALQLYAEGDEDGTAFDPELVQATVRLAERRTTGQDFREAVDRRPARRFTAVAAGVLAIWGSALLLDAAGIGRAFGRMASAWLDVRDITRRVAGAEIVIEPPPQPAFLRGEEVPLRIVQKGFHNARMALFLRPQGGTEWQRTDMVVSHNGTAVHVAEAVAETFECYGEAGQIRSDILTVTVTDRPRIVKISVEYEFPAYVQRAPVVQTRSDGDLKALYGSTVLLTIEASKPVERATLTASHLSTPLQFSVGGPFAQAILGLENPDWLQRDGPVAEERYRIRLADGYGFENADADREYRLQVVRDQAPVIGFVGLPHRSSAEEPHILERDIESIRLSVRARDDYGINRVVLHYRIEDLDSGEQRDSGSRVRPLGIPRAEVPHLGLARLEDLGPRLGERIVFWAEAEDAYDLEPEAGVHVTKTPVYRLAIVTEEELFAEVRYRDDWATYWYDDLKMATLARRAAPPRMAPAAEPAAVVAQRLLDALPVADTVAGDDRPLVEQYFESLIYE